MINSSFVHRNVIDRVKRKQGRYFFGFSLDFTAGLANAAVTDKFMRLSRPLSISAYSRHSSGYHFLRQETNALGSGRMKRDFGTIPTDRRLPGLNKLELVHANDMLAAKGRLFPEDDYICLDFTNLLREIAANINDRPQLYENTLAMMSQLAEQHNLDIARVIIPPRAERTPTWKSGVTWAGPHKMHFVADGNVFGMQSVADAVRMLGQFVPGQESFDPAAITAEVLVPTKSSNAYPLMSISLDELTTYEHWIGASIVRSDPILISTTPAPWGYSAVLPLPRLSKMGVADRSVFWEIDAEVHTGEAAIALMRDDELIEQRVFTPADGRKCAYLLAFVATNLLIRNGSHPVKSEIFLHGVRLVRRLHVPVSRCRPSDIVSRREPWHRSNRKHPLDATGRAAPRDRARSQDGSGAQRSRHAAAGPGAAR